jgi:hypothetical protein
MRGHRFSILEEIVCRNVVGVWARMSKHVATAFQYHLPTGTSRAHLSSDSSSGPVLTGLR